MNFPIEKLTREQILEQVKLIVLPPFAQTTAKVYLFGSWAKEKERRSSDIDVAIRFNGPHADDVISELRAQLEESIIPYRVDLVNMENVEPFLLQKIEQEGISWKD